MAPLVTCLIAAHDCGAYVERAVRSALGQKGLRRGAVEVLVIDDGSTDDTPAVLASFGDAITVLRQENAGPAVATNRGIPLARGRYIALLDADDEWLEDKLARQLELFDRRPDVALVHGDMKIVDDAGRLVRPSLYDWYGILPVVGRTLGRLLQSNEVTTTLMVRTDVARSLPPAPDWAWCRDWWIAAHVAMNHEIDAVREPVALYRHHGANFSPHNDVSSERAVRLWERDVRFRRLLLRRLDLATVTLDELAIAWTHFSEYVRRVVQARAIAATDVVPVSAQDCAEAAALRQQAGALLDTDSAAAGRFAVKAMAANPFDSASDELLQTARTRPLAYGSPAPKPSASHEDRLRELTQLSNALLGDPLGTIAGETPPAKVVLEQLNRLERVRASIAAGAPLGVALPSPTDAQREHAFAALSDAVVAADAGDPVTALVRVADAIAQDPGEAHARLVLANASVAFGSPATPRSERDEVARALLQAPAVSALDDARAFVSLADAQELIEDPSLLSAWARAFAPADVATLAIVARDDDVAAVHGPLATAVARAGLDPDGDYDLALLSAPRGGATELALARQAHVLLTRRDGHDLPGCLAGHPRETGDDPAALRAIAERRWSYDGVGSPLGVAIKICAPRWDQAERWGDTHFARALADELRRRGHRARIDVLADWDRATRDASGGRETDDLVITLRGLSTYVPREGQLNVLWNISHPDLVTARECDAFDLIATPSPRRAEALATRTSTPVILLEQATDPTVFFPEYDRSYACEMAFVGNSRGILRPIIRDLLTVGLDFDVWGQQWQRFLPARYLAGEYLANEQVRRVYSSSVIVLNDHWDDMRTQGIVSNRIYDALACGGCVLSDHLPELSERFGDAVTTYRTPHELERTVRRLLADPDERAERAAYGRALVLSEHTFRHRVDVLLEAVVAQRAPSSLKTRAWRPIVLA
jgi:glycosyltransferase involved in cell wall biosynthesis